MNSLIFEKSQTGRYATTQVSADSIDTQDLDTRFLRETPPALPEMSELDVVRHYTRLSRQNFSIDTQFYPLGSCTMKYNPRSAQQLASLPAFLQRHPLQPAAHSQGFLACLYELQNYLNEITGMNAIALSPMAGAQGEFAGMAMIRAYHEAQGESHRNEVLIPDAAHGTNPASAVQCGYTVRQLPTKPDGDLDLEALKAAVGPQTAAIMLTNPSTLGVFERDIETIAKTVHGAGGLLYYDGANLNAILGEVRPGDMGFDVLHLNLHKTFATPHGGGGPGAGPVAANERLTPFLPVPRVEKDEHDVYRWVDATENPQSIGRLSTFMGNAGVLLRAYIYIRLLGREGLSEVGPLATLNANYLLTRLREVGFSPAFPDRRATHEFIITLREEAKQKNVTAMDVAKSLLDADIHAPTTYFPLLIPECLLIEPTETESKQTLDHFVEVMAAIKENIENNPEIVLAAPQKQPIKRADETLAAKQLDLVYAETEN